MRSPVLIAAALAAAVLLAAAPALAAPAQPPAWKIWWEWGWRIVNFLILAFFIYKMARQPLKEFLSGKRAKVAGELEEMEGLKIAAQAELAAIEQQTAGLAREITDFEEAFDAMAAKESRRLAQEAAQEADLILERAQLAARIALDRAKTNLTAEMVELAASLAEDKLKEAVGAQDQVRLLEQFTRQALATKQQG